MPSVVIQVGAGAGNMDPASKHRDGFTEFMQGGNLCDNDRVILVEANAKCIPALERAWKDFAQVEIHQIGLLPQCRSGEIREFYYSNLDGPFFQLCSADIQHVRGFFPDNSIRSFTVECWPIEDWIRAVTGNAPIDLVALDVEGLDAQLVLAADWKSLGVRNLSFESVHLGSRSRAVRSHLKKLGYRQCGYGVDVYGLDVAYTIDSTASRRLMCCLRTIKYRLMRSNTILKFRRAIGTMRLKLLKVSGAGKSE